MKNGNYGNYHIDKKIDKMKSMMNEFDELK